MEDYKDEKGTEKDRVYLNTEYFSAQIIQNDEGIIIDVFHRHGELIDSFTYWNEDTIDKQREVEE